ncbi:MAG: HNH endonuclease family protein [Actinomycetia bacterium]|nr:HNH endonuclease family protein [Actinomycetes bacterium]
MKRRYVTALAAAALIAGWTAFGDNDNAAPLVSATPADPAVSDNVDALLSEVFVVDELPDVAGYDRGCGIDKQTRTPEGCVFGPAWSDPLSSSSCDTRNRLLRTQLHDITTKGGTRGCKITGGYLDPDPYTGVRTELDHIDADHVVPLRRAWDAGAWQWTRRQRQIFATDLTELIAVDSSANRSKSDSGLDEWLPSYQPCAYVMRYLTVAVKYRLLITAAERDIAAATCQTQ